MPSPPLATWLFSNWLDGGKTRARSAGCSCSPRFGSLCQPVVNLFSLLLTLTFAHLFSLLLTPQTNWFLLYSGSRTLSTSLETSLLLISLASYPQPRALGLASLSVMMRPTAALAWLPLAPLFCTTILPSLPFKKLLVLPLAPLAALLLAAMVDSFFYGFPIFTPLNFFKANVVEDLSSFYGVQGWWWYLSHTLVPILGPLLLPALLGLSGLPAFLSLPIISTIFVLSLLPHKEMRFLHPILPLLLFSAARYLAKRLKSPPSSRATLLLFLANIPLTIYLSLLHQQGVVAAAVHLGKEKEGALVLMPCHSTPLYSHIHEDVPVRFLTCNPPLHGQPVEEEEAEIFYKAPRAWIDLNYPLNSSYPSLPGNVLLFDNLEPQVGGALRARGLQPCLSWHHTHFPEGRIGSRVLLYCRRPISHPQK